MSHLPAWAIDGLREAGLSAEGFYSDVSDGTVYAPANDCSIEVNEKGSVSMWGRAENAFYVCHRPLPDAFRLASRLAAALEGKPCERCGELEKEVQRLRRILLDIEQMSRCIATGALALSETNVWDICRLAMAYPLSPEATNGE